MTDFKLYFSARMTPVPFLSIAELHPSRGLHFLSLGKEEAGKIPVVYKRYFHIQPFQKNRNLH
jgi:hypothetical protein